MSKLVTRVDSGDPSHAQLGPSFGGPPTANGSVAFEVLVYWCKWGRPMPRPRTSTHWAGPFASIRAQIGESTLMNWRSARVKVLVVVIVLVIWTLIARKRGYKVGGDVVVRCS